MNIITQVYVNDKNVNSSIMRFFKIYKVASILKSSNAYKQKGVLVGALFQYLFTLIFLNRSMYMNMLAGRHTAGFASHPCFQPKLLQIQSRNSQMMTE